MRSSHLARAIGLASLALAVGTACAAGDPCSPLEYGAVGDGVTDNTTAIQSAIKACAAEGGGVVRLNVASGKGTYLTSPISLASHVRLQLDAGVILLGTNDHSNYAIPFLNYPYHANEALVSAYQAVDTGIVGSGTIDGQGGITAANGGPAWWSLRQAPGATIDRTTYYAAPYTGIPVSYGVPRPWLVEFYQCDNVTVNGITLTNSPMWNLVLRYSTNITVSEYTVTVTPDPLVANTDGIDVVGSSHVNLMNLNIGSGGDSVGLRSGLPLNAPIPNDPKEAGLPQQATHDVVIVNSTFSNGNGIVVGSEAVNWVYNVVARNIVGTNTSHGLLIESGKFRGGQAAGVYNIMVQNMTLTNARQPLAISANYTAVHDITVSDLRATGATEASLIAGVPESRIRNVNLNNVNIATSGAVAGFQLRNMTGTFTNVTVTLPAGTPDFVVQENVTVTTAGSTPRIGNNPRRGR